MISGHEFVEKAREHIGLPYKWGGDFDGISDLVTIENVDKWAAADPVHFGYQKQQWLKTLFLGKLGGDCSGLLTHCLGLPKMYSGDIFGACEDKTAFDPSKPLNEQVPQVEGLIVWREGHIGVFCGDGYVIESGSTRYGVSVTFINEPQTQKPWTHYGWLRKYVAYDEVSKPVDNPVDNPAWTCSRVLKLLTPNMRGNDVKNLQKALNDSGFECGKVDGVFGTKTDKAIREFQKASGLVVDGKAGKATITKLGGSWTN